MNRRRNVFHSYLLNRSYQGRTVWQIREISSPRPRDSRISRPSGAWSASSKDTCSRRPRATARSMLSPGTVTTCRTSTTCPSSWSSTPSHSTTAWVLILILSSIYLIEKRDSTGVSSTPEFLPPITYFWTGLLILDHSYLVWYLTNSKIAVTKALEPVKSCHFRISNFRTW